MRGGGLRHTGFGRGRRPRETRWESHGKKEKGKGERKWERGRRKERILERLNEWMRKVKSKNGTEKKGKEEDTTIKTKIGKYTMK